MLEGLVRNVLLVIKYFLFHPASVVLAIQLATQESGGEVPAPTAHYKLLPNKNNLCAGRRAQTLSGKLKGEENSGEAEGGICPHG